MGVIWCFLVFLFLFSLWVFCWVFCVCFLVFVCFNTANWKIIERIEKFEFDTRRKEKISKGTKTNDAIKAAGEVASLASQQQQRRLELLSHSARLGRSWMLWHSHKRDTEESLSIHLFLNSTGATELTVAERKIS